ncbi:MAG: SDR family NAD(P)-dependent oxidoreductase, partial [Burkholderiales bacterium]
MSQRHLTILTGASRGMGLAMAQQLLAAGHDLLCIARHTNDTLAAEAKQAGRQCEQWPHDLARADGAATRLDTWLQARDQRELASVTLINNAGLIPRIAPLEDIPVDQLKDAMRVGLEAPLL